MIIPLLGFLTLEDYCTNSKEVILRLPKDCPQCENGLWRHGCYDRTAKDLRGNKCIVSVPRLLCQVCDLTISCLFSFLAPHKQYIASDLQSYTTGYAQEETTYRDVAWGEEDGVNTDAEASLARAFRAVAQACKLGCVMAQNIQRTCVESDIDLTTIDNLADVCPNSCKVLSSIENGATPLTETGAT